MPLDPNDVQAAVADQHVAAHEGNSAVRLVAGPGTGKSATVEERVRSLLAAGVPADALYVVSFTRASAAELRERVRTYCEQKGAAGAHDVRVSTLHSLALRVLRLAGFLAAYPAGPMVLDDWELRNVFDAEFSSSAGTTPSRSGEIRREHEAYWSTGSWNPPNWIPPDPAISSSERSRFEQFHGPRTQAYACVLPGEIVRAAVVRTVAGTLDPQEFLTAQHLIVDEFQDLNPADLEFVDHLTRSGVRTFVAGDDDQSIYSFRFADPSGIQGFVANHAGAVGHELQRCFRCTPAVLGAARTLIARNALPSRLPKRLTSLYETALPPVAGHFSLWRFATHRAEAAAIAESCVELIAAGVPPTEILILLSDRNALADEVIRALTSRGVAHEAPRIEAFKDTDEGRVILSLLRAVADADDYISLRVLLGLLPGVGIATCNRITTSAISSNLNFKNLFFQALPTGVFTPRETTGLDRIRAVTLSFAGWYGADTVASRATDITQMLDVAYGETVRETWERLLARVPGAATIEELRNVVWADNDDVAAAVLVAIYERLGLDLPDDVVMPDRVRVMTMHRAKGLSARVVFVPGMEEDIFPGERRGRYPGLVLEAARLLYVSITRARACCLVTFARRRTRYGQFRAATPSRFTSHLGTTVEHRSSGLSASEAAAVARTCGDL